MNMPKHQQTSDHNREYAGQKAKDIFNAAAAIVDDDSDTDSDVGSTAGSISSGRVHAVRLLQRRGNEQGELREGERNTGE